MPQFQLEILECYTYEANEDEKSIQYVPYHFYLLVYSFSHYRSLSSFDLNQIK